MTVATDPAQRACARAGVTVLELRTPAETERGAALLQEVWRSREAPVPANLLRTVEHTGGYVFGAYDERGALVGVSMALLSREGLHSHITGVVPTGQRRGLGFALKQHQRSWALAHGLSTITWTCDPLVRRNLAFNLHALGAQVHGYLPDESDRFELHWLLSSERATQAAEGRLPWATGEVTVPLPEDIEALRIKAPGEARAWRHRVRDAVVPALAGGAVVLGLDAHGALVLS